MSDVPYISAGDSINHEKWNTLFAEMDRKLSYALGGKSPICIGEYRRLPSFGVPFYFVSGTTPWANRFARTTVTAYDHSVMTAIASDAVPYWFYDPLPPDEATVSPSRREMVFWNGDPATYDIRLILSSLEVHTVQYQHPTADTQPETYWLIAGIPSRDRQQVERFAVAEIIAEGVTEINLPDNYDRFSCFRIHNLNQSTLVVNFGSHYTIALPAMQCFTVRRDSVSSGYTRDGSYLFRMREGDPRFYRFDGMPYHGYNSNYFGIGPANTCNNVVNPWQVTAWVDALIAGIGVGPEGVGVTDSVFWRQDYSKAKDCSAEMPWWAIGASELLGDAIIAKGRFGLQHKSTGAVRWAKWNGIGQDVTDADTGDVLADVEQQISSGLIQIRCANHYAINRTANLIYDAGAKGAADISSWYTIRVVPNLFSGTFYKRTNGTKTMSVPVTGSSNVVVTYADTTPSDTETTFTGATLEDTQGDIVAMAGDGDGSFVLSPGGMLQNWLSVPDSAKVIREPDGFDNFQNQILSAQLFNDDFSRSNLKNWSPNWATTGHPFQLPAGPQFYGERECVEAVPMKDTGGGFVVKWQQRNPVECNWPMATSFDTRRWHNGNTWIFPGTSAASIIAASTILSASSVFPQLLHHHYNAIAQAVNMVARYYPLNWRCIPGLPTAVLGGSGGAPGAQVKLGPFYDSGDTVTLYPLDCWCEATTAVKTWADSVGVSYTGTTEFDSYLDDEATRLVLVAASGAYGQTDDTVETFRDRGYAVAGDYITFAAIKAWAESLGFIFTAITIRQVCDLAKFTFDSVTPCDPATPLDGGDIVVEKYLYGCKPGNTFAVSTGQWALQTVGTDGLYYKVWITPPTTYNAVKLNYTGAGFEASSGSNNGIAAGATGFIGGEASNPLLSVQNLEVRSYGLPLVIRKQIHKTVNLVTDWRNDDPAARAALSIDRWPKQAEGPSTPEIELETVLADSQTELTAPVAGQLYPQFVVKLLEIP